MAPLDLLEVLKVLFIIRRLSAFVCLATRQRQCFYGCVFVSMEGAFSVARVCKKRKIPAS